MKTSVAKKALKKLESWCKEKGYTVVYKQDAQDAVDLDTKIVEINTRRTFDKRVYLLLHECGHIIEYSNGSKKYFSKYPLAKKIFKDNRSMLSLEGRVETVEEEINAWRQAEKLAKKLEIKINKDKFKRYASQCVLTYIDWAADRF